MSKMMNMFQTAVDSVKQHQADKNQRREDARIWVGNRPETDLIGEYFQFYFDKGNNGYRFLKDNHQCMWLNVKPTGVQLSWISGSKNPQNFRDVYNAVKGDKLFVTFEEIYRWHGKSGMGYFTALDNREQGLALENAVINRICTLPHIKFNGSIAVKFFG